MLKVKITELAERFKPQLREHIVKSPDSTPKERLEALGRDEKGRIKPLEPKSDNAQ